MLHTFVSGFWSLTFFFSPFRCIKGEPTIEEYYDLYSEAETYSNQISEAILQSSSAQQFLTTGRVVVVKSESVSFYILCCVTFVSA